MRLSAKCFVITLATAMFAGAVASAQKSSAPVMTLVVDESQAARRIAFVREEIKVQSGLLSLAYPSWIPGEHGPTGPLQQVAGLRIQAAGADLAWTRNPDNIFIVNVQVPPRVEQITVTFNTLLVNTVSDHQFLLPWNTTVLYPRNVDKNSLMTARSLVLPRGG